MIIVPLFNINISVRRTSVFYDKHFSTIIMVLRTFLVDHKHHQEILWCAAPFCLKRCSRAAEYL